MEKGFSIQYEDTRNKILSVLADSGLHSYVLRDILVGILTNVNAICEQQYKNDLENEKIKGDIDEQTT